MAIGATFRWAPQKYQFSPPRIWKSEVPGESPVAVDFGREEKNTHEEETTEIRRRKGEGKGKEGKEGKESVKRMQFFGGSGSSGAELISPSAPLSSTPVGGNKAKMMYVFNRNGVCLLYREWDRPLKTLNPQQDHKLMFGLLFSLKSFTAKMDPTT